MPKAKVIVIGSSTVGKSCIALRLKDDTFREDVAPTIGAANITVDIEGSKGKKIEFNIWDTAGQERYRSLTPMYFSGSSCALLVFDISREASFNSLNDFDSLLSQKAPDDIVKIVVGNKSDLEESREVSYKTGEDFALRIGAAFYIETSAKTGSNIKECFQRIADLNDLRTESTEEDEFVALSNSSPPKSEAKGCC